MIRFGLMSLQMFFIEQEFPDLFRDVMLRRLFSDSKTFADATPRDTPSKINRMYSALDKHHDQAILDFVHEWFIIPQTRQAPDFEKNPILEHIHSLWPHLTRQDSLNGEDSTRIPLPKKYVVPGGRFREIYYWDSYFTMLGLCESGLTDIALEMLENFGWLIKNIGFIPNGNRSYFLSRSQPPFFSLMIQLLKNHTLASWGSAEEFKSHLSNRKNIQPLFNSSEYLEDLLTEYEFWMDGKSTRHRSFRRCVRIGEGNYLNRYYDDSDSPRVESFAEDIELYNSLGAKPVGLYRNLRAACESGWDFSSRWLNDPKDLSTIRTTQILPLDLNVLMYLLEKTISELYRERREHDQADKFSYLAENRAGLINEIFWNDDEGYFADFWFEKKRSGIPTLAMSFPLFASIATPEQAGKTANYLEKHFLKPGGWATTNEHTGQQWDAPNGWAPLQWIAFIGLRNYKMDALAKKGAERWLSLNEKVYNRTGRLMEKYNIEDMTLEAGGGEYPVQDGFGWTNGVYLALKKELARD